MSVFAFINIIVCLWILLPNINMGQHCEPCEVNARCRIAYTLRNYNQTSTHLIWTLEGKQLAICYIADIECIRYPGIDENILFYIKSESGFITTQVVFSNATRISNKVSPEQRWELYSYDQSDYSHLIHSCNLKLYTKVKDANCSHHASPQGLRIQCVVSNVYNEIVCVFELQLDNQLFPHASGVIYNHTSTTTNLIEHTTECHVNIPVGLLIPGNLFYNISISPDINLNDRVEKTGVNREANISLEKPKIYLANCSVAIQENQISFCTCAREDNSDIKTLIHWSSGSNNTYVSERTLLLSNVQQDTDYTCTARNEFGWTDFLKHRISKAITEVTEGSIKQHICPRDQPYNCSAECYSDDKFCLHGEVYACLSANLTTLKELCQSRHCKKICHTTLPPSHTDAVFNNEIFAILAVCVIVTIGIIITFVIVWQYRRKRLEFSKLLHKLQNDKKNVTKEDQVDTTDLKPLCSKEHGVLEKNLMCLNYEECSEIGKHSNLILCSSYARNSSYYLTQFNVFDETDIIKKFILSTINLTVKLIVSYVSENRTQNDSLIKHRGEIFTFTGTGRVVNVKTSDKPCNCPEHKSQGGSQTWTVDIATTTHVVFDEAEAASTTATVELFDDDDESGVQINSLNGKMYFKKQKRDACVIQCETCDTDLSKKLASALTEQRELSKHLPFNNDTYFVVSYPHGQFKHICFGRRSQVKDCSDVICPGCFGASVLMLHDDYIGPLHYGCNDDGEGVSTICHIETDCL